MARLSDQDLDHLAGILRGARLLVQARAAALSPPAVDDVFAWRAWSSALAEDQLAALLEALGDNPAFPPMIARLRAQAYQSINDAPHELLPSKIKVGFPNVDRADIWEHLKSVRSGDARILQVSGSARAGKTYIQYLVYEICNRLGKGHSAKYVDLDGGKTLSDIATEICGGIGQPMALQINDTSTQGWPKRLADDVFELLVAKPELTRWLVFDHFERSKQTQAIIFFSKLADSVALAANDPNTPNGPRLVLIDHDAVLTEIASRVAIDGDVRNVEVSHVERFLMKCQPASTTAKADARRLYDEARGEADRKMDQQAALPGAAARTELPDLFMEVLQSKLKKLLVPPAPRSPAVAS